VLWRWRCNCPVVVAHGGYSSCQQRP